MAENTGISETLWNGLKNSFVRMAIALTGQPVKIITLAETDDDLGMTDLYKNIYLNPWHKLVRGLPEKEAVMMITGVYGHETMHQLLTDFSAFERVTKTKPEDEQEIFHMVCNIIEDPTIEYFAGRYFGGKLLKALRFCVLQTYRQSPPLEESKTPAAQFFNALIQYGDGGILKGRFTFPEARSVFHEVIPFVDNAIETLDVDHRVRYMDKVFELSRPIWEPEKEFMQKLHELWKELGRDHGNSTGFGDPNLRGKLHKDTKDSITQRRRQITFRRVSKEEAEEWMKRSGERMTEPNANIEVLITSQPIEVSENTSGVSIPEGEAGPGQKEEGADSDRAASTDGENQEGGYLSESNQNARSVQEMSEKESVLEGGGSCQGTLEYEEEGALITEDEYHLSEEMLAEVATDIAKAIQEGEKALFSVQEDDDEIDLTPSSKEYNGVKCINHKVSLDSLNSAAVIYSTIVAQNENLIGSIVSQFKRIFRNDAEEKEYRNSGKLSVRRLADGRKTTRVFERRRLSGNKSDMAVIVLVDESGSMQGEKTEVAKKTAIILSEAFARLHVPIKVIGFTEKSRTVEHFHYQSWKNTLQERYKLLNISAREANFDGYSIRYASDLINKCREQNKLMIVISDGRPVAGYYESNEDGINDTRNSIQHSSKKATVLGILVGSVSPEQHQYMYGTNFLHIAKASDLPTALAQRVKRIVKGW